MAWICQSCSDHNGGDAELDGICYNGNAIVEITLQRDYLLLRLQDLVDSQTSIKAETAIQAMDDACQSKPNLQHFLVRAGTISILHDVVQRPLKEMRPSMHVVVPLLRQLQASQEEAHHPNKKRGKQRQR